MDETNYCAHAIEDAANVLRNVKRLYGDKWVAPYKAIYAKLKGAVKFRLPDNGITLGLDPDSRLASLREFHRLPYPCVALEFRMDGVLEPGTGLCPERILLCWETGDESWPIQAQCLFRSGGKWVPYPAWVELAAGSDDMRVSPNIPPAAIGTSIEEFRMSVARDVGGDLIPLSEFLSAISCSNVEMVDSKPTEASNKKRAMRGKTPFFTYKTLVLKSNATARDTGHAGSHASPRVHLRRGHIRRLPDKRVWVNACVVGDKSLGMVVKDYRVAAEVAP